ncbi:MAG: outer membrane protein assembly factor BamB [Myxococcota bacterium]
MGNRWHPRYQEPSSAPTALPLTEVAVLALVLWLGCSPAVPEPRVEVAPAPADLATVPDDAPPARPRRLRARPEPEPEIGLWNDKREPSAETIAQLEALGYIGGETAGTGLAGVTVNDPARVQPGLNLWTSGHGPEAHLMDASGTVVHTWRRSFAESYPGRAFDPSKNGTQFWRRVALLPDGHLLVVFEGQGLVHLDRDSNVVWAWSGLAHHDLEVLDDGRILVLSRRAHLIPRLHPRRPVLEDFVSLLSPEGEELRRVSVLEAIEQSPFASLWQADAKRYGDVFHTNAVERLDGSLADRLPEFTAGRVLVSSRALHAIAVIDLDTGRAVWGTKGDFARQHDPHLLPGGRILLFDNLGQRDRSSVIELDPLTGVIGWSWGRSPEQPLFSRFCGAATRLGNGNTLITESGNGRALEVTTDGEVVWEFHNPNRAGPEGQFVAILPEVTRVSRADVPWLEQTPPPDRPDPAGATP